MTGIRYVSTLAISAVLFTPNLATGDFEDGEEDGEQDGEQDGCDEDE